MKTRPIRPLEALRAFGVTFGGSIVLLAAAVASIGAVARAVLSRFRPPPLASFGALATALYVLTIRPRHLRWGSEPGDERLPLPGDDLLPEDGMQISMR